MGEARLPELAQVQDRAAPARRFLKKQQRWPWSMSTSWSSYTCCADQPALQMQG
jgi:hypothetical protein